MELTLGKRIAMLRRQKGLKQDTLAEVLGVSPQAVSKWENDQTCPDISLLPKLAELLEVSVDELLSGKKMELEQTAKVLPPEERKDIKEMTIMYACGYLQVLHLTGLPRRLSVKRWVSME